MLAAKRWGFDLLRTTGAFVYPSGFLIRYDRKRYVAEELPALALWQDTPEKQAELHSYLCAVAKDLSAVGPLMRGEWGLESSIDENDLTEEGYEFNGALRSLYIAIEGLRSMALAGQRTTLVKDAPATARLYLTGVIDTSFRPLHPELRENSRFLYTKSGTPRTGKEQVFAKASKHCQASGASVLSLNSDRLEDVLLYADGAVYEITGLPMHLAGDRDELSRLLSQQYLAIRRHVYCEDLAHFPAWD